MGVIADFLMGREGFLPHGVCLLWSPGLLGLHLVSDLLIALSYFSIPLVILRFLQHRRDLDYPWIGGLFVVFIAACGFTHLMDVAVVWRPAYGLQGVVKALTAAASVATAALLWYMLPKLTRLPTPTALREANARLVQEASQRQVAERRLQRAHDEMENRVRERTADLSRLTADLEQFTYIVSHDLKSPLRGMRQLVKWLRADIEAGQTEEVADNLALLENRLGRMESLVTDLLEYARIGRSPDRAEAIDVKAAVEGVKRLIHLPEGFEVAVGALPEVHSQRAPLETVFRNLMTNAIKHHDRGAGQIEVAGRRVGGYAEFTVRDDGPGIDPRYRDEVFKIFRRLVSRDSVEGSGVGLSVVKRLVELHGGTIAFEDPPEGRGALVRFTWPAVGPEAPPRDVRRDPSNTLQPHGAPSFQRQPSGNVAS
ncbi:MAG: HAMP domain-containing histidine kinase [Geminicoccaceae bacterium]|nr:HAMP domain-containing histidine kinase [Geminicoccaceae bacterium]